MAMPRRIDTTKGQTVFEDFREKYAGIFGNFLDGRKKSEFFLNEAYKLGRLAISQDISLLGVTSVHHDILMQYLQHPGITDHMDVARISAEFFEDVMAPFNMVTVEFRGAISLLERNVMRFAMDVQSLKNEISNREEAEKSLHESLERYQVLYEQLKQALKDRESLLREVYHRVKNNLQVITSLIHLQIASLSDRSSRNALRECETRIRSMAMVHEMLYQSSSLSEIELRSYMEKLLACLFEIYRRKPDQVRFSLEVDPVWLNVDRAITVGLLVNEIVSNSLKHAFRPEQNGMVYLKICAEKNRMVMVVGDNGKGIPAEKREGTPKTLGMRLIFNLVRQLGAAEAEVSCEGGTCYTITTQEEKQTNDGKNQHSDR